MKHQDRESILQCIFYIVSTPWNVVNHQWRIQDGIPPGVQTEDGVLAPLSKLKNGAPRRRCWMGEGGSILKVIISFSDNVIGIRLLKIALTLNWLVLNVRASSTRKFEMLSEKWGAHYSVHFMNNFGLLVWAPINRYYWVILGIIVKYVFKKIFKIKCKKGLLLYTEVINGDS